MQRNWKLNYPATTTVKLNLCENCCFQLAVAWTKFDLSSFPVAATCTTSQPRRVCDIETATSTSGGKLDVCLNTENIWFVEIQWDWRTNVNPCQRRQLYSVLNYIWITFFLFLKMTTKSLWPHFWQKMHWCFWSRPNNQCPTCRQAAREKNLCKIQVHLSIYPE